MSLLATFHVTSTTVLIKEINPTSAAVTPFLTKKNGWTAANCVLCRSTSSHMELCVGVSFWYSPDCSYASMHHCTRKLARSQKLNCQLRVATLESLQTSLLLYNRLRLYNNLVNSYCFQREKGVGFKAVGMAVVAFTSAIVLNGRLRGMVSGAVIALFTYYLRFYCTLLFLRGGIRVSRLGQQG